MAEIYLACYEETDSYDYERDDKKILFDSENELLNFVSNMFVPNSNSTLEKIFKINTSKTTICELVIVLENMQLAIKEKEDK